ncbi:unnamed protein product [Symbiodinium pilosum]|uniref:OTU domain-containing protein n=1 Tax=Symbiodinium pilosum TaxID=2952 RepID=A0A812VLT7_SYMPI|nr:unnamed protein product [Symbiodinium pilosum]
MAFPTTSKAVSEAEVGVDGKPVPGAKRTKCDVRTVPSELQTIDIAKDGNCVYRAIAEGLAWLSAGKLKVEHRELRAKAIAHLQKHKEAYSAQWDKESPSGDPMQSFDDYLAASAQNCAYGSPLEVEALARVYDVQIILIPCIADFAIMRALLHQQSHQQGCLGVPDKPRASCKRKLTKTDSDGSQDLSGCHEVPQTKRIYKEDAEQMCESSVAKHKTSALVSQSLVCIKYAAGTFEVQGTDQQRESILVVAVYFQARNEAVAQQQATEVVAAAASTGLRYVVIGDYNLEQHQASLGHTIQSGGTHACDSCDRTGSLPNTGPGRKRRIDFALSHWRLQASSVHHRECYFSDHLVVKYHFLPSAPSALTGPCRKKIADRSLQHIEELFQACQTQEIRQAIEDIRLDSAWGLLSDLAEQCLCEPSHHFVPRSADWNPTSPRGSCKTRKALCSPAVAGLRKLYGRLRHFGNRAWDLPLAHKILVSLPGVRRLAPELPFFSEENLRSAAPTVRQVLMAYEKQERDAILYAWKAKLRQEDHRIRAFVKNRTEQQLLYEQGVLAEPCPERAKHPANAVHEQASTWTKKWNSVQNHDWAELSNLLQGVQRPQPCKVTMRVTAVQLQQNARAMSSKVGGADSWEARDLVRLPTAWWELAAAIWNRSLEQGRLPKAWCKAKVVLLWKKQGRTRPISLFSILWRSGARALATNMRPWCESWQSHYDAGGLPATSVSAAHMQLYQSLRQGAGVLAQQDLAAFFDSIQWGALETILLHLRAPPELLSILSAFYKNSGRIFVLEGAFSSGWTSQLTGIAQGCPLSPYLAAAVTHCWCELTITQGLTGFGYLDDRTILLQEGFPLEIMHRALHRSAVFDRACGLTSAPDKCFLAARQHTDASRSIALQFGLQVCDRVDVLGLTIDFYGGWQLLKFSLRKAVLRLRLLKWTQTSTFKKQKLVRSLVLPCLHWAAAFAIPSKDDLFAVKQEIFSLFNPWYGQEAARVLIFEHLSWQLEPEYATDIACLREIWRFVARAPKWTDTCPLVAAFPQWHEVFPRAQAVLDKLKWRLIEGGRSLQRLDTNGASRTLEVGVDSFKCVHQWLTDHFRGEYMKKTGKTFLSTNSNHALDENRSLYVSTDGGSKDDVGSFAIHFEERSFGAGTGHEDQSAFRQELNALLFLSRGLKGAARSGARRQVFVICDCQAAISAIQAHEVSATCPRLIQEIKLNIGHAQIAGITTTFIWVPSHGKKPNWSPAGGHEGQKLRELNERVDAHCTEVLNRRLQGSLRQRWHAVAHHAMVWEYKVIHASAKAAERLHEHFKNVGATNRDRNEAEAS